MGWFTGTVIVLVFTTLTAHPVVRRFGRNGFLYGVFVLGAICVSYLTFIPQVAAGEVIEENIEWLPQLSLNLALRVDALSLSLALLVTGAGALILLYSRWYFHPNDQATARFTAIFLAFSVSMLGLVISDNVFLLFMFWESTTVFSFLLVAHNHRSSIARSAALQALVVTTLGGLGMLAGFVILANMTGTASLAEMLANPPAASGTLTTAIMLIMLGALTKSAIFPFHFWLPGAMAAPTPVSAYLHAAAMVKAGVYLIARFVPAYSFVPGLLPMLVLLGAITMVWGAMRALRQYDIKLIIAHGTVSQLGMLVMLFGLGMPGIEYAALTLLFAHAVAKAPLFLTVGIIDHSTSERDLRNLSGIAKRHPGLAIIGTIAAASMAGLPIFIGFVAKEAALTALLTERSDSWLVWVALVAFVGGSALTVAYMARFVWGAFGNRKGVPTPPEVHKVSKWIYVAPTAFVVLATLGGLFSKKFESWLTLMTDGRAVSELGLWHGITPALIVTLLMVATGLIVFAAIRDHEAHLPTMPERYSASHAYWRVMNLLDVMSVKTTATTQRGSLPFYIGTILITMIVALAVLFLVPGTWPDEYTFLTNWAQLPLAIIMIAATIRAAQAKTRFKAVVLVGVTGYGMVAIFALHGAPDLAVTQALVETITMIAFILVIRQLPIDIKVTASTKVKILRGVIAVTVALGLGMVALLSLSARTATPISEFFGELAVKGGHGVNVVNVTLVDIRGWDTMGELSVVLAAATGVASLIFLNTRGDNLPKTGRKAARLNMRQHLKRVADPNDPTNLTRWSLAGYKLLPEHRSIILEVVVRLLFPALIIVSIYLLLAGHNAPGGGFAAGLVAGLALVARYQAGGRHELAATVTLNAGRILGLGLILATGTALVPLFFGQAALASSWFDLSLGPFGEISFVTSTIFDIGVYLVVFGLMLDVLRSLGSEIDEQEEHELAMAEEEAEQS
ncbi:Na+/H+ antiporter subunit A [Leucobacter sp. UCMA 4100]|uniref:Na+/H+ antiporter subunit A n=1 Tax=Leucobacter sp. UCMA 4100 TaxID=2810534 RepID=UPI0022EB8610|nr:Na+/H+ antiporter subunit A [Leucobacter sp. UCMA 4100]MDA3148074.1 Na+/H+ antiporter subunit A [Leucobacter sp. UCMA 4100]